MGTNISLFLVDSQTDSRELLRMYTSNIDYLTLCGEFETLSQACTAAENSSASIIIADIEKDFDKNCELISKITENNKTCKIIVTSANYNTDTIIKSMRAGAVEFLPKPIIHDDLNNALEKIKTLLHGSQQINNCKIITAFSNKGGIGKTSIAVNLALELANITKEKVALVDLNLQLGDVATFLDIKPSFDISYVVKNLTGNDEMFLLSTLEKYKNTSLYVLADPPYMEQANDITPDKITMLFDALRKTFSYIIVDTGTVFDGKTITVLDNTDFIMLATIVNLPAIRNCQRCLDIFERLGYDKEKTKIVINRYMENDEVRAEDVESTLNQKVFWKIPNNYFTIMSAINKGLPVNVVNPASNIAQSYRELATILADNIYKQKFAQKIVRNPLIDFKNIIS